ncbi:MAG: peptide ABC transporter substrate-binding protein [Eubacteriales bacterium]|nr:peptide ABC transporter substrate-binding protein [Eubacteriales bacterium]
MKNIAGYIKAISLIVVLCLLAAGCTAGAPANVEVSAAPTPSATPAPPAPGGELVLPMPMNLTTTNPLLQNTREMNSLCALVFESLVLFDSTGAPQPNLAEAWQLNADTGEWAFTLCSNATWQHNGRALAASDVTFTLDITSQLGDATPYRYVLDTVKSWRVSDDGKLILKGDTNFYGLLNALSFPILPADAGYSAQSSPTVMVGTGPYKVTSAKLNESMLMLANESWWRKQPYIQTIRVLPVEDAATAISSLVFKQISALQTTDLTVRQYREAGDANTYEYTTRQFEFLSLNSKAVDLRDVRTRQAIAYALDRAQMVSYVYVNHAIAVDSPVPPDSWLYSGNVLEYEQDLDTARSLLVKVGWKDTDGDGIWDQAPDGTARQLKLSISVNMDDSASLRRDTALIVADQLSAVGMVVDVKSLNWENYKNELEEGLFDMAMVGVYMNPVPDWRYLLRSDGAMNYGKWSIPALDAALDAVQQSANQETLKANTDALQSVVMNELPIISLYFHTHTLMTAPEIAGVASIQEENAYGGIASWYFPQ